MASASRCLCKLNCRHHLCSCKLSGVACVATCTCNPDVCENVEEVRIKFHCNCKKDCSHHRCGCRSKNIACNADCLCTNCTNMPPSSPTPTHTGPDTKVDVSLPCDCPPNTLEDTEKNHKCYFNFQAESGSVFKITRYIHFQGNKNSVRYCYYLKDRKEMTNPQTVTKFLKDHKIHSWDLYKNKIDFDPQKCLCCQHTVAQPERKAKYRKGRKGVGGNPNLKKKD